MGQPIQWEYGVLWTPEDASPKFTLWRISSAGHRFRWAHIEAPTIVATPSVDVVLEGFYGGLLGLMEATA